MDKYHRELLRAEIKSTAYHRRQVKARARKLYREAQRQYEASEGESGTHWGVNIKPSYKRYLSLSDAASALRGDRASHARSLNIASGLLRGIPYKRIEAKCKEAPNAKQVLAIIQSHTSYADRKNWTLEKVKELLQ